MLEVTAELLERYDRPGPRYTSYPPATEFHDGVTAKTYVEHLERLQQGDEPLSVYTHLPFCESRCLYCACNVIISPKKTVGVPYLEALEAEISLVSRHLGDRRDVAQFHLGGGTPTYYSPDQLRHLLAIYRQHFRILPGAELSVELDPRVTTDEHLDALAEIGFNRVSLGVQDLDQDVQEAVHRIQPVERVIAVMEGARSRGMDSVNIDLIYGLPYQTPEKYRRTVEEVIALRPDRLAVYSFAWVPWMKGHQKLLPQDAIPKGRDKLELFATACDTLQRAGYVAIGLDHFALPTDELPIAQSEGRLWRNFMGYTTLRAPDMLGFGVSSIGSVAHAFIQNEKKLSRYYEVLGRGELPVEHGYVLDRDDRIRQHVIAELMCNFHLDKRETESMFGISWDEWFRAEAPELDELEAEGFLVQSDDALEVVGHGRTFVRNIAMIFDRHLRARESQGRPAFSRTV